MFGLVSGVFFLNVTIASLLNKITQMKHYISTLRSNISSQHTRTLVLLVGEAKLISSDKISVRIYDFFKFSEFFVLF